MEAGLDVSKAAHGPCLRLSKFTRISVELLHVFSNPAVRSSAASQLDLSRL